KQSLLKVSQTARFLHYRARDSEMNKWQNELGRMDVYRKYFDEKRALIQKLPGHPGIERAGSSHDPLPEYLDGLAAFRDIAVKNNASLILTGEATLYSQFMGPAQSDLLLAYISLTPPTEEGNVNDPRRPRAQWVIEELDRFAAAEEEFASKNKLPW